MPWGDHPDGSMFHVGVVTSLRLLWGEASAQKPALNLAKGSLCSFGKICKLLEFLGFL